MCGRYRLSRRKQLIQEYGLGPIPGSPTIRALSQYGFDPRVQQERSGSVSSAPATNSPPASGFTNLSPRPHHKTDQDTPQSLDPGAMLHSGTDLLEHVSISLQRNSNQLAASAHVGFRKQLLERVLDHTF
jgi:hypothetical protein